MKFPLYAKIVLILFGLFLFFYILHIGSTIVIPIFIALLFSLLILPFCEWMERKGLSRGAASFLSVLSMILIILVLGAFIAWQIDRLTRDMHQVEEQLMGFVKDVQEFIEDKFNIDKVQQQEYMGQVQDGSGGLFQGALSATSALLIASILLPMSMFFMLFYRNYYLQFLFKLYPRERHEQINKIIHNEKKIVFQYLTGILTVVLILAIFNYIALSLFGLDQALLFAVLAALLNIIPLVGTFLGSIIPVLYALVMEDSIWLPIGIALYFWMIQILESNVITPNIVGGKVRINPYAIILAIFLGGQIWGAAGMVLFIPMLAIFKVIFMLSDDLEPYGFLLTDPSEGQETIFQKIFKNIKKKLKK